ncbi:MAG: hypothetical protein Greene041662_595 [Candidatus Peregrinibacteria bacterium Greene0416_62]|nr:MAG: hypothetical protein Greene041662_595 [Candidatus Peregrinibacteria bacterium Greene0416_62]TSC98840.1 MAG: hypothetical protein Greene101449_805 [Candidatus Peregrinibacteria bacterium Greene1014_49]
MIRRDHTILRLLRFYRLPLLPSEDDKAGNTETPEKFFTFLLHFCIVHKKLGNGCTIRCTGREWSTINVVKYSFFCVLFSLTLLSPKSVDATAFSDVPDNHPLAPAILEGMKEGYVRLGQDRVFGADIAITRGEFAFMLARASPYRSEITGCIERMRKSPAWNDWALSDADYDAYYGNPLCVLQNADLFGAFADDSFQPAEGVTFAEASRSLSLTFGLTKLSVPVLERQDWKILKPYASFLSAKKVIPPSVRGLAYPISRGDALTMLYRLRHPGKTMRLPVTEYQLASHLTDPTAWSMWQRYGMSIPYRSTWPEPHIVQRGMTDRNVPKRPSVKHITIGERRSCRGIGDCIERDFILDLYPVEDRADIWRDFEKDATIRVTESWFQGSIHSTRYRERGERCTNEGLLVIGPNEVYRLLAPCLKQKSEAYAYWLRLLRGFTVYPASDPRSRR